MSEPYSLENWRSVVGFERVYEVSDNGRVRRIAPGPGLASQRRVLRPRLEDGRARVALYRDGRRVDRAIAVLVAEAFLGPRPSGREVNHLDGNKSNDAATNLEWTTRVENVRHAVAHRLYPQTKLSPEIAEEIRTAVIERTYGGTKALADRFGVSTTMIRLIRSGRAWATTT